MGDKMKNKKSQKITNFNDSRETMNRLNESNISSKSNSNISSRSNNNSYQSKKENNICDNLNDNKETE